MTYKENSKKYIENYDLSIGDTIKVHKEDISYTGILLDRPEDAEDRYLVLKLSSGYNIGVAIENTTAELIEKGVCSIGILISRKIKPSARSCRIIIFNLPENKS